MELLSSISLLIIYPVVLSVAEMGDVEVPSTIVDLSILLLVLSAFASFSGPVVWCIHI